MEIRHLSDRLTETDSFFIQSRVSNIMRKSHPLVTKQINSKIEADLSNADSTNALPNPLSTSNYAYVTLISGIDKSFRYRGFLYNAILMRKSLRDLGSSADFIALIGYSEKNNSLFMEDMNLLKSHGIILHELPRLLDEHFPLSFAEMALLKITPWSFTHYERVQFFDGDVLPTKNMDCFFSLDYNSFTIGAVSPLNSGKFVNVT